MKKHFNKVAANMRVTAAALLASIFTLTASQPPQTSNHSHSQQFNIIASGAQNRAPILATSANVERNNMIIIRRGYGGEMNSVLSRYEQWIREGKYIVVDGRVVSADAFGAFNERYQNRVCYTANAVFSPHAARYQGHDSILPAITDRLARSLVPALEREFRASPYYHTWRGSAYIDANRLREIYPEGECSEIIQRIARQARP